MHERYSDLNEINREEFRERENEVNAFAAAFLLPATAFGNDVAAYPNRLSHYVELKKVECFNNGYDYESLFIRLFKFKSVYLLDAINEHEWLPAIRTAQ